MTISFIISGILILLSIPQLMGKGENFIAGYNTMSQEEKRIFKKTHDIKEIGRSIGIALILIALTIAIIGMQPSLAQYGVIIIVIIVAFLLIYINFGCRKKMIMYI